MQSLVAEDAISTAASLSRLSIQGVNFSSSSVRNILSLTRLLSPTERLRYRADYDDTDILMNSWYFADGKAYDFGVGAPKALRRAQIGLGAFGLISPNLCESSASRVYELTVLLPHQEFETLEKETDFLKYFKLIAKPE